MNTYALKLLSFLSAILLSVAPLPVCAQQIQKLPGLWEGKLDVGVDLRIVLHIKANDSGRILCSLDSPDQSVFGIKADSVYSSGDSLFVEIKKLNAVYAGKLINDSTLFGTFNQGRPLPLSLKKVEKLTPPKKNNHPQHPKPPYSYYSYDVEYDNADKTVHFGGTLTVPKPDSTINYIKRPVYPTILLITGSGQQDRDETIMGQKPFLVIADYFTRLGYAVLRVDDRGMGKTKGDLKNATSMDFASDVEAGIEFLRTREEVDKNKIGLMGHSEGGMIAPIVASRRNDISFIILLAGPGVKVVDLMAEQNAAILKSSGIKEISVDKFKPLYKKVALAIIHSADTAEARRSVIDIIENWVEHTDSTTVDDLDFANENNRVRYAALMTQAIYKPWYKYFISFDPQPYLRKLSCKVLALNGSKDIQVISQQNLEGIRSSLKRSKTKNYEVREIAGLNHLFQTCKQCSLNEYAQLEETFSPIALQMIAEWLNKNVK